MKKNKKTKIKEQSATYTFWDDTNKLEPLAEEMFKKFWEETDKNKPPKYLYLMQRESIINKTIRKIIPIFIKILDNIVGYITNTQTKLYYYLWNIKGEDK